MTDKPRYDILDGLRGVAALAVLGYHLFEAVAFAAGAERQQMYHGFLAVDFFFILSGFVMGYAYDERWNRMSLGGFVRRRLVRLHPMVVMGVAVGVATFCMQGCTRWDGSPVGLGTLLTSALLALLLIPTWGRLDVRGNTEMFALNGPHWSLFFEYIGSLLYGLLLRRMRTRWLAAWVALAALALAGNAVWQGEGWIAYGWSSEPLNMLGGLLRLAFGYPAGLLMARAWRKWKPAATRLPAFTLCALAVVGLLSVPYIGAASLGYQVACVVVGFPLIIWLGARGTVSGWRKQAVSFVGRLSYPLYAVHYPLVYLYIHWINTGCHPFGPETWRTPVAVALMAIVLATLCLVCYDEPLRKKLASIWK